MLQKCFRLSHNAVERFFAAPAAEAIRVSAKAEGEPGVGLWKRRIVLAPHPHPHGEYGYGVA